MRAREILFWFTLLFLVATLVIWVMSSSGDKTQMKDFINSISPVLIALQTFVGANIAVKNYVNSKNQTTSEKIDNTGVDNQTVTKNG